MKDIYILSSCNIWKEYQSMSLVAATLSVTKIKKVIIQRIKDGEMEYKRGEDYLTKVNQIKKLKEDWKIEGKDFVFNNLDYGYVQIVHDGEIQ